MKRFDFCCDIEADSLNPTLIHLLCMKVIGEDRWVICREPSDLQKVLKFVGKVIFHHNYFDLSTIRRLWGIPFSIEPDTWGGFEVEHICTRHLSMWLNPDRIGGHSLANLSQGSSAEKMNFRQACIDAGLIEATAAEGAEFKEYSPLMERYCRDDVLALEGVYLRLAREAATKYGDPSAA